MGCWGMTAFESDQGLDTIGVIKRNLPKDGVLKLDKIIDIICEDEWIVPPNPKTAPCSHTSPMALTELMIKYIEGDLEGLDYSWENDSLRNKFCEMDSFFASKESIKWLKDYLENTLQSIQEDEKEEYGKKWGGWFKEKNWIGWQNHMTNLINYLDTLIDFQVHEENIELITLHEHMENKLTIELSME